MKHTALLLDDEEKGRNALGRLIHEYCPDIDLVATVESAEDALSMIYRLRPQILFLDIEIARSGSEYSTSFDLIPKLPKYDYEVIFVSAFEHYALRAIRTHAIGYVLKPIAIPDLVQAVEDATERLASGQTNNRAVEMVTESKKNNGTVDKIWIHSQKDIVPVNTSEIIRFEAQGKYTDIFCLGDKKFTSSKNLGEFSEILPEDKFIKVHRSHIINIDHVTRFSKSDGGYLVTKDDCTVPVSKNGKDRILHRLN